ncbi:MAG: neutral/alkaline non-lysosomal ceramidase N-terminal domain-containing protein [Clostridia bacterium]|nr:neutral/alkaline non-lysosomal ceramidase N-terminal domain-containing protein [Clostridia bacterium]
MIKCAFYEKEITPPLGCNLPGYGNLRAGSDVKDRLMAKACVILDENETVALIAIDCLHITHDIRDEIAKRVNEFTPIKEENVLVAATHTHTGIPQKGYDSDQKAAENQNCYFDIFPKLIADCAILAYKRLEYSQIYFAMGKVDGISFCRDYIMKNSTPRTNPGRLNPDIIKPVSQTDNELPVIFIKNADGKPMGAITAFACHQDCVGGTEYSGDFSSEISNQMKKSFGQDFVILFFEGTAGDINHFNVNTASDEPDHYRKMGLKLSGEIIKNISFAEKIKSENIKCRFEKIKIDRVEVDEEKIARAKHIIETVKPIPGIKIAADGTSKEQYDLMMAKKLLWMLETSPEIFDIPLHYIQIGDIDFFGLPSEIYCYFGTNLKERNNNKNCIVATCCNGAYGYVPTKDMFYDTIYESTPGSNRMDKNAGYIMVDKLIEMSKQ